MAVGKVAISSPAQYCGLRLRRGTRIRERARLGEEYRGQRLAGLAHEIFLKLLKAKREVPGAAETLAAQDGKRALCGCGLTAGTCELDHVAPVRQAFAGSVQILQALCGDCRSEKTLRESAQPTSLESRVAPGVMEYARSPKLPPLVFEAQACHKDALYVGEDQDHAACVARTTLQPLLGRTVQFDSEMSVGPRICSPMAATTSSAPPSSGKRTAICSAEAASVTPSLPARRPSTCAMV